MKKLRLSELHQSLRQGYLPLRNKVTEFLSRNGLVYENNGDLDLCQFDERFLQALWNEQFFAGPLETVTGIPLRVISSGTWNLEPGPDFKNAAICVGDATRHGDVEIHRRTNDWFHHGHNGDCNYENVILHVVWEHTAGDSVRHAGESLPPCFEMRSFMDRPWQAASEAIDLDKAYPYARQVAPGGCAPRWAKLDDCELSHVFQVAGLARLREKASQLQRNAIAYGTDQSLYESVFEALGYKANKHNFRTLAHQIKLSDLTKLPDKLSRQAALFGTAGLLPDITREKLSGPMRHTARQLWDAWWRLGRQPLGTGWQRGTCRPLNSPERRLAAGLELMERWEWHPAQAIKKIVREANTEKELVKQLRSELSFTSQWDSFTTLKHSLKRPARLLGESRQRDLITNVLLPAAWAITADEEPLDPEPNDLIDAALLQLPRLQNNRALKEAAHRFLLPPSRVEHVARRACEQQGVLALYKDFCVRLDRDCSNCPLMNSALLEKLVLTR